MKVMMKRMMELLETLSKQEMKLGNPKAKVIRPRPRPIQMTQRGKNQHGQWKMVDKGWSEKKDQEWMEMVVFPKIQFLLNPNLKCRIRKMDKERELRLFCHHHHLDRVRKIRLLLLLRHPRMNLNGVRLQTDVDLSSLSKSHILYKAVERDRSDLPTLPLSSHLHLNPEVEAKDVVRIVRDDHKPVGSSLKRNLSRNHSLSLAKHRHKKRRKSQESGKRSKSERLGWEVWRIVSRD
jgi:hypothetical protein